MVCLARSKWRSSLSQECLSERGCEGGAAAACQHRSTLCRPRVARGRERKCAASCWRLRSGATEGASAGPPAHPFEWAHAHRPALELCTLWLLVAVVVFALVPGVVVHVASLGLVGRREALRGWRGAGKCVHGARGPERVSRRRQTTGKTEGGSSKVPRAA